MHFFKYNENSCHLQVRATQILPILHSLNAYKKAALEYSRKQNSSYFVCVEVRLNILVRNNIMLSLFCVVEIVVDHSKADTSGVTLNPASHV